MGYYDEWSGNVGISSSYFDAGKMTASYDKCVELRYHPPRGNKTATEAVVAHEMGHALTGKAAEKLKMGFEKAAHKIVYDAIRKTNPKDGAGRRISTSNAARRISGYAGRNESEAIAEAFADVYCNGRKAKAESRAIVNELNSYFRRRRK